MLYAFAAFAADIAPPAGTWVSTTEPTLLRFAPTEYAFVSGELGDRRAVTWTVTGAGYSAGAFSLTPTPTGWRMSDGRAAQELRPATPAEIASFEATYARTPSPAEVCPAARACCEVGMPLLGGTCDVAFQLGSLDSSRQCSLMFDGMASLFVELKKPLPAACLKPGG
jgi:hypothetical protein